MGNYNWNKVTLTQEVKDGSANTMSFVDAEHITDYTNRFREFLLGIGFQSNTVDEYIPYAEI